MGTPHVHTVIVGGGPAGLAPLVAASRDGRLDDLLDRGVAIVERSDAIGAGRLGRYAITSDSTAETFLTAVSGHRDARLGRLIDTPLCRRLALSGRAAIPLQDAAVLMADIGAVLADAVTVAGGAILTGHEALRGQQRPDGTWTLHLRRRADAAPVTITADTVLLATGGAQDRARLRAEFVAGQPLLPAYGASLVLSDEALQPAGIAAIRARLTVTPDPKVAIVGGSTSALAATGLLLREAGDLLRGPGSIAVLHRRPLRLFYPSAEAAHADGYTDFGSDDLCPVSGFVFRFAGMRLDSRDLLKQLLAVGGASAEPRVRLHRIPDHPDSASQRLLAEADVVIAATGYRPRALPLFDADGAPIPLRSETAGAPLVDRLCRICDARNAPLPGLFGIGLAAGFRPSGPLGGEPSFVGQANGLWLWQTAIGALIVDALLAAPPRRALIESGPKAERAAEAA